MALVLSLSHLLTQILREIDLGERPAGWQDHEEFRGYIVFNDIVIKYRSRPAWSRTGLQYMNRLFPTRPRLIGRIGKICTCSFGYRYSINFLASSTGIATSVSERYDEIFGLVTLAGALAICCSLLLYALKGTAPRRV
jgi:hypothetical protein